MTSWVDARIKCPFYKFIATKQRLIICEPILSEAKSNKQAFASKGAFNRNVDRFCAAAYEECPVYKAISKERYHDDEI